MSQQLDAIQNMGLKFFNYIEKNSLVVFGGLGAVLLIGMSVVLVDSLQESTAKEAQERFYLVEKSYLKKKESFASKAKDAKAKSGDMSSDYGNEIDGFKKVITDYSSTSAAAFAAFHLSEIYQEYEKLSDATKVLTESSSKVTDSTLLSSLMKVRASTIMADSGDCAGAIKLLDQVIQSNEVTYVHPEAKLKKAFCLLETDKAMAKSLLEQLSLDSKNQMVVQTAQRVLRTVDFSEVSQ
jgi:predicted negative regulator of RcsB-dependent stress response